MNDSEWIANLFICDQNKDEIKINLNCLWQLNIILTLPYFKVGSLRSIGNLPYTGGDGIKRSWSVWIKKAMMS